ncbi:hypothetical protein [Bradyrhizobium sp. CCBAU 51765]|uniref:hypothetical protein n=1 Tax=Bradyrhizobium sp. CCBAU 51765 TaxID=1325102 RepID=UPI001889590E|nr:hypothetical protein [Bradyrhizobium sp. CCBAU 51765]
MTTVANPLQISRFLHLYDSEAAKKGIKLSIGFDFRAYVSITGTTATKEQTGSAFRPDHSPIRSGDGFWMVGVDRNDNIAVLQAVRLFDLSRSNLAEHIDSMKVDYANPAVHADPRTTYTCLAQSARQLAGKVAYHGDAWVRSDYRGQGMPKIMAGVAFGVSFAMWAPDYICALVAPWLLEKGVVAEYGYTHHESGGLRMLEQNILSEYVLIWLTREELASRVEQHDAVIR